MQCVYHTDCPKNDQQLFLHWLNYADYYKTDVTSLDPFLVLVVHIGNKRNAKLLPCLRFVFSKMRIADNSLLHLGLTRELLLTDDPTAETIKLINRMAEITMTDEEVKDTAIKVEDGIWGTFVDHKIFLDVRRKSTDQKLAAAKLEKNNAWNTTAPAPAGSLDDEALRMVTDVSAPWGPDCNFQENTGQQELTEEMIAWKHAMDVAKLKDANEILKATEWNNYFPQGASKHYFSGQNSLSDIEQLSLLTDRPEWKAGFEFASPPTFNVGSPSTSQQGCAPVRNPYATIQNIVKDAFNPFSDIGEQTVTATPEGTFIINKRVAKIEGGVENDMVVTEEQKAEMQKYLDESEKEITRVIKQTFEEVTKLSQSNAILQQNTFSMEELRKNETLKREFDKADLRAKGIPIYTNAELEYFEMKKAEYDKCYLLLKKEIFHAKKLNIELRLRNRERDMRRAYYDDVSEMPPLQDIPPPLHHLPVSKPTKKKQNKKK